MVTFRCVRCGEDVDVPDDDVQIKKSKRGSHYYSATCPHCGSKLARFGAPAPEEYEEEEARSASAPHSHQYSVELEAACHSRTQ